MNTRKLLSLFTFLAISTSLFAQGTKYHLLIGTYTAPGKSEGIYVYEFDTKDASTTYKSKVAVGSPSYFAVTNDRKFVYAVSEDRNRNINAMSFNSKTGELKLLNSVPSGSGGPTYISVDANGKYVFVGNYGGGTITALPINPDGTLGSDIQDIKHEGKSIAKTKPYVHSAVVSPDNKFVITADLGTDKMNVYAFDAKKRPNPLTPTAQGFVSLAPGSGPRHSTFHPNKKFYYAVTELDGTVNAFTYKNGRIDLIQTIKMADDSYTGKPDGADIHVSADGKFLYATTRNVLNEIAIYSIDQKTGKLTVVGRQPIGGKSSRTFDIDPSGNWMLVTSQGTNEILFFKRDQQTGLLTPTGQKIQHDRPSLVKFVKID
ncbi:MAG: lactonase family protein [Daejeonella sp.]|uniref:lactonase family protein n=1 Tax=Daejeonella sp. JGW-45 TaxID=3034148 RepID=UPI0023ED62CE|nr:lactonase family protein [Daejeonella sp. JGW-45]